jgi:hypothetical protein
MSLKKTLMKQAMKLMQSDAAMKLMQNPKVMNTVMQAFTLKGKIEGAVTEASEKIATTMGFATKEEVQKLRAIIQDLENQLEHEQSRRDERPVD